MKDLMLTTEEICRIAHRDPVLSLLVPLSCVRSLPIPFFLSGRLFVGLYFFTVEGEKGADKQIRAPLARVAIDKESGRVVEVVAAPLCYRPGDGADTHVASFPPPKLKGLAQDVADQLYRKYYALCDEMGSALLRDSNASRADAYGAWREAFASLMEPGFDKYYAHFGCESTTDEDQSLRDEAPIAEQPWHLLMETGRIAALDLSPSLQKLGQVIHELKTPELERKWTNIRKSITSSSFRAAVVGEFLRGKSTVVNKLIGENLLPSGNTPTTALPTRVVYASERTLTHLPLAGASSCWPLTEERLQRFALAAPESASRDGMLIASLPCAWLRESGVEIIDTPGVGDPAASMMSVVEQIIAACDGAIVCVNASMPLSLTERAFLEETVLTKSVPRVAIMLTRLNAVEERERGIVVERVRQRLESWNLRLPVWCLDDFLPAAQVSDGTVCGVERVRAEIVRWARSEDVVARRKIQVASQALELCSAVVTTVQTRLAVEQAPSIGSGDGLDTSLSAIDEVAGRLASLTTRISERQLLLERSVESDLVSLREDLKSELSYELSRARNPREWWDRDLPFSIRRCLKRAHRELESRIGSAIANDISIFNKQLVEHLATTLATPGTQGRVLLSETSIIPSTDSLTDLDKLRLWTRVGSGVATAVGYILLGAPTMLLSLFGGIAGDQAIGGRIEQQRQRLGSSLDEVVDHTIQKMIGNSRDRLRQIYGSIASDLDDKQRAWVAAAREGLKSRQCGTRGGEALGRLLEEARRIRGALAEALGKGST